MPDANRGGGERTEITVFEEANSGGRENDGQAVVAYLSYRQEMFGKARDMESPEILNTKCIKGDETRTRSVDLGTVRHADRGGVGRYIPKHGGMRGHR